MLSASFVSFCILGVLAILTAAFAVTRRWPVSSAMLLIVHMILLAGLFGVLEAHFSAVSQIIVYAGAIMVVFVFVIMLLNLPPEELRYGRVTLVESLLVVAGAAAAVALGTQVGQGHLKDGLASLSHANVRAPYYPEAETVKNVAALMFTDYLWAFELISFLILAAIIGAVVIAKQRKTHVEPA